MSSTFMICTLTIVLNTLLAQAQSSSICGGVDWRFSPHSQKCYKLFNTKIAWPMAEFKCVFMGAHHISIHDLNDNYFLAELAKQAGIVWLGAAQFGTSKNYVWSDSTPFAFEHWKDNRRPNYHKGRKCSKLDGNTGDWLQSCCKVPAAYICAKPAVQLPGQIIEEDTTTVNDDAQQQQQNIANNSLRMRLRSARLR